MALRPPAAGETWRLTDDFGVGPGALTAGTDVQIDCVCPPGTPGVGLSEHDTVIACFNEVDGTPRNLAYDAPQFLSLFKKVS